MQLHFEGMRHRCDHCDYSATLLSNLNHHIKIQESKTGIKSSISCFLYMGTYSTLKMAAGKKEWKGKRNLHLNGVKGLINAFFFEVK